MPLGPAVSAPFDVTAWTGTACEQLRSRLTAAGYTVDGVAELLGPAASAALGRNETSPAQRALDVAGGERQARETPLRTMVRLWTVRSTAALTDVRAAFGEATGPLVASGVLVLDQAGSVRAAIDIRPYGDETDDGWVVSDLTPGLDGTRERLPDDYVLGVNEAATTLAQLTLRRPVARALDLGTGSGIQTLHLCRHAGDVVGTDVNERALAMARLTAALNGLTVAWRSGSLLEPVAGQRFDLVVSNPPFVVSPAAADGSALTYRDSGRAGDVMVAELIRDLPGVLAPGGVAQLLANWAHIGGIGWRERIEGWLTSAAAPVDAWVVQREVLDPASYVELWLRDAGIYGAADYRSRYRDWLDWFGRERIDGVGMGWVCLRRPMLAGPVTHRLEELAGPVDQPMAPAVQRWLDAADWLRRHGDRLADAHLQVAPEVLAEQWSRPGMSDAEHLVLRQQGLTRRGIEVDTALAGFVGACDGDLSVSQVIDALAVVLDVAPDAADRFRAHLLASARELLVSGLLLPPA